MNQICHKILGVHVNVFSNKLKVVQHDGRKKSADIACYGLHDPNKIQTILNSLSENIYTLLGLALMVCIQLERKHQF